MKTLVVAPLSASERVDRYLASVLPDLSRSRLKALLDEGHITLEGRPLEPSTRVRGGETLHVDEPDATPIALEAQDLPLKVVFQDKHLLVLDKAAGMVVHPGAGNADGTLVNALLFHVPDLGGIGGELRPGIVHRIDKDTSGLLVVAKNEPALVALQAAFKNRAVEKTYLALVHGTPKASATLSTLYGRHPRDRKRFSGRVKSGKPAITHYRVREQFAQAALIEVVIETGRTHQIRAHLSEAGHPLLGDTLYGGSKPPKVIARQALHAWKLAFPHPKTGKVLAFEAKPPKDFQAAVKALSGA